MIWKEVFIHEKIGIDRIFAIFCQTLTKLITGTGGGKRGFLSTLKHDDSNSEQQLLLVHFTICNKYCDSQAWLVLYS